MIIESRRRGPAFAFPPAGAWLYFIRSPEYWPALTVPRPGLNREVRPIGLNLSVENKPSLHCLVLSPSKNGLGQGVMEYWKKQWVSILH